MTESWYLQLKWKLSLKFIWIIYPSTFIYWECFLMLFYIHEKLKETIIYKKTFQTNKKFEKLASCINYWIVYIDMFLFTKTLWTWLCNFLRFLESFIYFKSFEFFSQVSQCFCINFWGFFLTFIINFRRSRRNIFI